MVFVAAALLQVLVRGRLYTVRGKGKSAFLMIRQRTATVQVRHCQAVAAAVLASELATGVAECLCRAWVFACCGVAGQQKQRSGSHKLSSSSSSRGVARSVNAKARACRQKQTGLVLSVLVAVVQHGAEL
jgi:hypothetical protein